MYVSKEIICLFLSYSSLVDQNVFSLQEMYYENSFDIQDAQFHRPYFAKQCFSLKCEILFKENMTCFNVSGVVR